MKKTIYAFLMAALTALPAGAFADNESPVSCYSAPGQNLSPSRPLKAWFRGKMPCPENTVYAEALDPYVSGNKGYSRSDMSLCLTNRGDYARARAFMPFDGVTSPVEGVMVHGLFMNTSYTCDSVSCLGRFALDNYVPTKPLRMAVEFYTNNNGRPGVLKYKEEFDVMPEKSEGIAGEKYLGEEEVPVYRFTMKLKEKMRMENGFLSVYACDTGEKYNTAFYMLSDANVKFGGILRLYSEDNSSIIDYAGSFNFCMLGDKTEYITKKGLKFTRVLSPEATERGKFAKVQVEIKNICPNDITDATLQLYEGNNLLAEERIPETIFVGEPYKYTFRKRIDCSGEGIHNFTIENATPGDEHYADRAISFTTSNNEGSCDSHSTYTAQYKYITKVEIGNISQESSWSQYSDFREQKTDIKPGETLKLNVEGRANNGDFMKVWVDWNGNGVFDDAGEFIGYVPGSSIDIKIPDNARATAGEKTMRIILSNEDVSPCQTYTFGETEDYTLNIVRPDNSAALEIDKEELDLTKDDMQGSEHTLTVKNEGDAELTLDCAVDYQLPLSPDVTPIYRSPKAMQCEAPVVNYAPAKAPAAAAEPAADDTDPLVLTYAGNYSAITGASNRYVNYAHFYPRAAMKSIAGMKISSIDVYIANKATTSYVAIWKGAGVQFMNGDAVTMQEFTPVENSWNHIVLEKPVTIGKEDLFIGCAFENYSAVEHLVGVDRGPSVTGFGDLISVEDNKYWFALSDLGYDGNVLIRANVTGERTSAVNWLSIDKKNETIPAGGETKIKATINAENLGGNVYDGVIKLSSNDPLAPSVKVPVYLDLSDVTGISVLKGNGKSAFSVSRDRRIAINTDRHVAYIALFTMDGRQLAMNFDTNVVDASALQSGIYVAKAVLDDETVQTATIAIK